MSVLAAIFGAFIGLLFLWLALRLVLGVLGFLFSRPGRYRRRGPYGRPRSRPSVPPGHVPVDRGPRVFWPALFILVAIAGALYLPMVRWLK